MEKNAYKYFFDNEKKTEKNIFFKFKKKKKKTPITNY